MGTYISTNEVRALSGVPTSLIDDETLNSIIDLVESKVPDYFGFTLIPTNTLEFFRGYDLNDIKLIKQKIMTIQAIDINGSNQDTSLWTFDEDLGKLQKNREHKRWTYFEKDEPFRIKVKYSFAMLKPNGAVTESNANVSAGTSVAISVDSEEDFILNDYVRIKGFDGYNEVAKITSISSGSITVDKLYYSHESGSVIEKLDIPEVIRQYMFYEACVGAAINAIGGTYTFNTSYNIEGISAVRGVPYPHFEKSTSANQEQRDTLAGNLWALKSTIL